MHARTHTHTHTHTYTYMHTKMCTYPHIHTHTQTHRPLTLIPLPPSPLPPPAQEITTFAADHFSPSWSCRRCWADTVAGEAGNPLARQTPGRRRWQGSLGFKTACQSFILKDAVTQSLVCRTTGKSPHKNNSRSKHPLLSNNSQEGMGSKQCFFLAAHWTIHASAVKELAIG